MPDTSASQSIVSADVARDANLSITPTSTELCNASHSVMRLVGEARIVMCNDKHSTVTTVLVSPELNHSALIGYQDNVFVSSLLDSLCCGRCQLFFLSAHQNIVDFLTGVF